MHEVAWLKSIVIAVVALSQGVHDLARKSILRVIGKGVGSTLDQCRRSVDGCGRRRI